MAIHVLIVDDHRVVRQGPRMLLELDHELVVIGEAANGEEAVRLAVASHPDVVLMDLVMPVLDGIAATAAIRRDAPGVAILALTSLVDEASVVAAVRAGAIGYMLKDADANESPRHQEHKGSPSGRKGWTGC